MIVVGVLGAAVAVLLACLVYMCCSAARRRGPVAYRRAMAAQYAPVARAEPPNTAAMASVSPRHPSPFSTSPFSPAPPSYKSPVVPRTEAARVPSPAVGPSGYVPATVAAYETDGAEHQPVRHEAGAGVASPRMYEAVGLPVQERVELG